MIAAAFKSLKSNDTDPTDTKSKLDDIDERIINSKTVLGLLSVAENSTGMSRNHALKVYNTINLMIDRNVNMILQIVSILAEWSSINRAKLSDFENDPRFIKLCRQLGRTVSKPNIANSGSSADYSKISGFRTDDLNTVMGIAGDDEAAKLIASISLPQMIRVLTALAAKKRRSTPLLRSLAYNISSNSDRLDLKQCADILYSMSVLNFPDSVLIARVGMDIQNGLTENVDKPSAVRSILTSLGLLKFRNSGMNLFYIITVKRTSCYFFSICCRSN